jgi:hypothetical protein
VEGFGPASTRDTTSVKVKVKVTLRLTVGQSVSFGVEPHLGLMTRYLLLFDSYGLFFLGRPLWREDGSVFCVYSWPRQRSLSGVRVPWISRPYFTLSVLRLSFSSPPTTRRVTVEVFDPASTRVWESRYIAAARTTLTENICHLMVISPVHWRAGCFLQETRHVTAIHCCADVIVPARKCVYRSVA